MKLVSAKEMLDDAVRGHYAVGHFNLNNMESVRAFLLAAQEVKSPIILGVSGGTAKYMGGYRTITDMVQDFINFLDITVPVALHVDHGKYSEALDAIENGFSSVMFDGSSLPIEENIEKTKELVAVAHQLGLSIEAEVGSIGGEEVIVEEYDVVLIDGIFVDFDGVDTIFLSITFLYGFAWKFAWFAA